MRNAHVSLRRVVEPAPDTRGQTQALMRGLRILRILVDADKPMSATEIGRICGLHQSSVSRILATLTEEGYVRKETYRSFAPDYGILALAVTAQSRFDLVEKPRQVLEECAVQVPGLTVSLCMLWREQMIYFLRTLAGRRPVRFEGDGYPMHLSSPALRFIADMPNAEGEALLARSRERFGWSRPTERVPKTAKTTIKTARSLVVHDCLVLADWGEVDHVSAAIPLRAHNGHPLALALTGPKSLASEDKIRLLLHEMRRSVEAVLDTP
jgi:DNA-binding IclR family transcriptional regulator